MKTIGCCDSGLGGFLTAKILHEAYPSLDVVFIADQSHIPYGDKTVSELEMYTRDLMNTFKEMGIKDVVVACNTLCANAVDKIQKEYPELNIINIIQPTALQLKGKDYKRVTVLATRRTIETHLYKKYLSEYLPQSEIVEIMAPTLVPLIEQNANDEIIHQAIKELVPFSSDAWVLGCTHYPLIAHHLTGDIYDSNQVLVSMFKEKKMTGEGKFEVYTTKNEGLMKNKILELFDMDVDVKKIQLKQS